MPILTSDLVVLLVGVSVDGRQYRNIFDDLRSQVRNSMPLSSMCFDERYFVPNSHFARNEWWIWEIGSSERHLHELSESVHKIYLILFTHSLNGIRFRKFNVISFEDFVFHLSHNSFQRIPVFFIIFGDIFIFIYCTSIEKPFEVNNTKCVRS